MDIFGDPPHELDYEDYNDYDDDEYGGYDEDDDANTGNEENNNNNNNNNNMDDHAVKNADSANNNSTHTPAPTANVENVNTPIADRTPELLSFYFDALEKNRILKLLYRYYFSVDYAEMLAGQSACSIAVDLGRSVQLQYYTAADTPGKAHTWSRELLVLNQSLFEQMVELAATRSASRTLMSIHVGSFAQHSHIETVGAQISMVDELAPAWSNEQARALFSSAPLSIDIDLDENDGDLKNTYFEVVASVVPALPHQDENIARAIDKIKDTLNTKKSNPVSKKSKKKKPVNDDDDDDDDDGAGDGGGGVADIWKIVDDQFEDANKQKVKIEIDPLRVRYCCSLMKEGGKEVCDHCWNIAVCHAKIVTLIAKTYHADFAKKKKERLGETLQYSPLPSENKNDDKAICFEYNFSGGRGIHIFCRSHALETYRCDDVFVEELHSVLEAELFAEMTLRDQFPVVLQLFTDLSEILVKYFEKIFCEYDGNAVLDKKKFRFSQEALLQQDSATTSQVDSMKYSNDNRSALGSLGGSLRNSIFHNPFLSALVVKHAMDALSIVKQALKVPMVDEKGEQVVNKALRELEKIVTFAVTLDEQTWTINRQRWKRLLVEKQCHYRRVVFYIMLKMLHPRLDKNVSGSLNAKCGLPMMFHKSLTLCYPFIGESEEAVFQSMSEFGERFQHEKLKLNQLKLSALVSQNGKSQDGEWCLSEEAELILRGYKDHLESKLKRVSKETPS